jgi:hypothetical protein
MKSPSATEGVYLAYLFAADGSRVYLSLNQGTSEYKSGKKRPVIDGKLLRSSAAGARAALSGIEEALLEREGHTWIDLAATAQAVGSESVRRIRNYQDANILALEYRREEVPDDVGLLVGLC